jgi:O-antigen/teichoic acid export membrane protein
MLTKPNKAVVKSVAALAAGNVVGAILTALGGLLIARFIEPEINGKFRAFSIPLMYLTFLHLGTFDGLYRQIPFYTGKDQPNQVQRIASASGAWNIIIATIVSSGFFACALWSVWNNNYDDAVGWLTQVIACIGIFYGGYLGATYRTLNHFVTVSGIQLLQSLIGFFLVIAVVYWGYYGLALRFVIPVIVAALLLHIYRPLRMSLHFDFITFKDVIKIGMPLCFWGTLYSSIWLAAEFSLVLAFGGVKAVGLFSVAVMMRESLSILPQSLHQVLMPRVVESFARKGGIRSSTKSVFLGSALFTLLMAFLILIIGFFLDYFVPIIIPKYVDGLLIMKTCLWIAAIHAASLPLNGLVATGRGWLYGKGILVGMVAFASSVYFLIPILGGVMAAIVGSLFGRLVRVLVAYVDLMSVIRKEQSKV